MNFIKFEKDFFQKFVDMDSDLKDSYTKSEPACLPIGSIGVRITLTNTSLPPIQNTVAQKKMKS